jgi:repressor LexA
MKPLANNLKTIRKSLGLTQQQVADAVELTRQAYNHYETQRRKPDPEMLKKLATVFGCSIDRLLDYDDAPSALQRMVPIRGFVRAGYNMLAQDEIIGQELVDVKNPEEFFCLYVKGDSMEPEIHTGDLALVHRQSDVESGELAVVLVGEEEGTIKRVVKSGRDVALQAFNPSYPVRLFSGRDLSNLRILGKVVKTSREW